jgi:hypothetical protein
MLHGEGDLFESRGRGYPVRLFLDQVKTGEWLLNDWKVVGEKAK